LKLIDSAVVATRRIINDLRPSILDNLGVWAAIEWQTNDTAKRAGIDCEVSIAEGLDNIPLTPALSTALFRIVQESLNNIRHHARANKAQVRCRCEGNDLAVEVRDDGVGFDLDDAGHAGHWGLIGMHERALAHGGMLEMSSARGAGTRVCVRFPLPRGQ
jgi:two-component system sensor histidine kinase UhpB